MCNCSSKAGAVLYIEDDKVVGYKIEGWNLVGKQTDRKVVIEHCLLNELGFSIEVNKMSAVISNGKQERKRILDSFNGL